MPALAIHSWLGLHAAHRGSACGGPKPASCIIRRGELAPLDREGWICFSKGIVLFRLAIEGVADVRAWKSMDEGSEGWEICWGMGGGID